jgi:preprotein translocase subunit SecE
LWRSKSKAAAPESNEGGRGNNAASFGSASQSAKCGEVAEWSIAAVLKTAFHVSGTGVRIPPSPPAFAGTKGERGCRAKAESDGGRDRKCGELRPGRPENFFEQMTKTLIWIAVIGVVFGVLWWQGQLKRFAAYWQQTMEELRKCTWPTWDELKGSTVVVMVSIALLSLLTFVVDQVLFALFIKL